MTDHIFISVTNRHYFAFIKLSLDFNQRIFADIYIFLAIALDESIFLDVLHFPMKNIKSRDVEATPMGGATSTPIQ